jgi:concentrative nucleoside transporter, CNT family
MERNSFELSTQEHTHDHLHHGTHAQPHGADVPIYTLETNHAHQVAPSDVQGRKEGHGQPMQDTISKSGDGPYDIEKGSMSPVSPATSGELPRDQEVRSGKFPAFYRKHRIWFHLTFWIIATGWWAASLGLHHADMNWVVPFLLWLAISLRLLFLHVPISIVTKPMHWTWNQTGVRFAQMIPEKFRLPLGAALTVAVILIGSFVSQESEDNTRENRAVSLFGLVVLLVGLWATSRNRKAINWHTVIVGMLMQFIVALFVLRTGAGYDIFDFISGLARSLLGFAKDGVAFLTSDDIAAYPYFFFSVLPAIIFFVSIVQLLYYWGTLQWFIGKAAVFFFWAMRISGAEAVVAAATPFIGQGESAMLIKPFVAHLTMAELHQVMCCGFATIAGSVLVAYIGMGVNPQALISSCVMSIPASLAVSKIRYPEEEQSLTAGKAVVPDDDEHRAANSLDAFAKGAYLGLKIAGMILCTLLCIIALVALINALLTWFGRYLNLTGDYELTLELILGYMLYIVAFLLGVPRGPDLLKVARLIGMKIITVRISLIINGNAC